MTTTDTPLVTDEQIATSLVQERFKLFSYLWAILRDAHAVEDVMQELSLLALRKREAIADVDHLAGWLRTSGRHLALKAVEKAGRQPQSMAPEVIEQLDEAWSELDRDAHADALEALRQCIGKLSASSRRLLQLRYVGEVTGDALAVAVGQSRRSCYRHLAQVGKRLAECIDRVLSGNGT